MRESVTMAAMQTKRLVQVMRILWGALSASIVMLFGVMHQTIATRSSHPRPLDPTTQSMMLGLSAVVAILSFVLPMRVRTQGVRLFIANLLEDRGQGEGTLHLTPKLVARLAARVQTSFILSMAFSEAVAMFGFVVGFLNGSMLVSHALLGAGFVLALLRFPSRDTIFGEAEKQLGRPVQEG